MNPKVLHNVWCYGELFARLQAFVRLILFAARLFAFLSAFNHSVPNDFTGSAKCHKVVITHGIVEPR